MRASGLPEVLLPRLDRLVEERLGIVAPEVLYRLFDAVKLLRARAHTLASFDRFRGADLRREPVARRLGPSRRPPSRPPSSSS